MAKEPSKKIAADAGAAPTNEIPLSLNEFCLRQSRVKGGALVTAFFHTEQAAGRMKDLPSAYAERYAEFATTPAI